ncbi:hypothetical protein CAG99_10020 [Streptomyces marincola]|uniref:Uncharacterized protein n=1 Tax=Streptomyces marincola TaxID=2878388 RepID=A0A1W7CWF0_9ACTN|nr:hypothetical protein CAG99_10020 [Streptomyces marincola]
MRGETLGGGRTCGRVFAARMGGWPFRGLDLLSDERASSMTDPTVMVCPLPAVTTSARTAGVRIEEGVVR